MELGPLEWMQHRCEWIQHTNHRIFWGDDHWWLEPTVLSRISIVACPFCGERLHDPTTIPVPASGAPGPDTPTA